MSLVLRASAKPAGFGTSRWPRTSRELRRCVIAFSLNSPPRFRTWLLTAIYHVG